MRRSGLLSQLQRSRDLGFLGGIDVADQVLHAESLLDALTAESLGDELSLLDLGSGGGLPGLVAAMSPIWSSLVLLDRSERRCAFLRSALASLDTRSSCAVACGDAELFAHDPDYRECFSAVCARSFGPPAATIECASGFVRVGGHIVVSDPPMGRNWPSGELEGLGVSVVRSAGGVPAWTVFAKVAALSRRFPRRSGLPAKRPLFDL